MPRAWSCGAGFGGQKWHGGGGGSGLECEEERTRQVGRGNQGLLMRCDVLDARLSGETGESLDDRWGRLETAGNEMDRLNRAWGWEEKRREGAGKIGANSHSLRVRWTGRTGRGWRHWPLSQTTR